MFVLDRGQEHRESKLTVLCLLIIIILISYIFIYYIMIKLLIINLSQNRKRNSHRHVLIPDMLEYSDHQDQGLSVTGKSSYYSPYILEGWLIAGRHRTFLPFTSYIVSGFSFK
jgi:hypothetical protein